MNSRTRQRFDEQLEWVLQRLPPVVHELIERVPLHVEDHPSSRVMAEMGVTHRAELCGLYTGIPLDRRSVQHSGTLPDVVTIYREGILESARDARGRILAETIDAATIDTGRLRSEIRITILHELAHHHGLDEDELHDLGYG